MSTCPARGCGKPAYVGFTGVKCTSPSCAFYDASEAADLEKRETLPPKKACIACQGNGFGLTGCALCNRPARTGPCTMCGGRGWLTSPCENCGRRKLI